MGESGKVWLAIGIAVLVILWMRARALSNTATAAAPNLGLGSTLSSTTIVSKPPTQAVPWFPVAPLPQVATGPSADGAPHAALNIQTYCRSLALQDVNAFRANRPPLCVGITV